MYKHIWSPCIGELFETFCEEDNEHNKCAIAVHLNNCLTVVGHIPREITLPLRHQGVGESYKELVAQYCLNLPWWFSHETTAFYSRQCTSPSLFHNFQVISGSALRILWTMALFGMPLCCLYSYTLNVYVHTKHSTSCLTKIHPTNWCMHVTMAYGNKLCTWSLSFVLAQQKWNCCFDIKFVTLLA